ncbi:MAG TPA: DUF1298 domain-containing protein, partial [Alphaproteobacteria bacterium]|nr:DUF1298 domain-containing protein [Alphaproteobacteria bacterium]
ALMSYNGRIFWGLTGDYELVPDLERFTASIADSFIELARAAGVDLTSPDDRPPQAAANPVPNGARPVLTAIEGARSAPAG